MTSITPDELANRLDQALPPHNRAVPDVWEDGDPAVQVALRLARAPHPVLAADAVARIETQVLQGVRPAVTLRSVRRPVMRAMRWAAAASLVLIVLSVTTATASAKSLPGDTLYPVKLLVERGRLAFASESQAITLRLEYADRRQDEFEELLTQGEVNLDALDDALDEMQTALDLVQDGSEPRTEAAQELFDLSERQMSLAEAAADSVTADESKTNRLQQVVESATEVQEQVQEWITPGEKPQVRSLEPGKIFTHKRAHSLAPETATFIPTDFPKPVPSIDPDATAVFIVPTEPPAAAPVTDRPRVYEPDDPDTPPNDRPPADNPGDDPGTPPDDRPPADDPGDDPGTPPVEPPPADDPGDDPGTPPDEPPPADDPKDDPSTPPDVRPPADDPGDDPIVAPDEPPADDPGIDPVTPPDERPPADDPDDDPVVPPDEPPPADDPGDDPVVVPDEVSPAEPIVPDAPEPGAPTWDNPSKISNQ